MHQDCFVLFRVHATIHSASLAKADSVLLARLHAGSSRDALHALQLLSIVLSLETLQLVSTATFCKCF